MNRTPARFAFVLPALALGGAERQMLRLVNALARAGVPVSVLVLVGTAGAGAPLRGELHPAVDLHELAHASTLRPALWLQVRTLLRRLAPSVVVGWSTYANLVAALAGGRRPPWRLVLSERNFLPLLLRSDPSALRRRLVLAAIRHLYPRADLVTANTARSVKAVRRVVGTGPAYDTLLNLIDLAELDSRGHPPAADPAGWSGPRLLFVGRLVPQKGVDVLLRAMSLVRHVQPWSLRIVGDGPMRDPLRALARDLGLDDAIRWEGAALDPYPFYRWADVVLVPSRHEGFPNVVLEAMACGRAVIVADCRTGPREITEHGRHGVLVPVDDPQALARAILALAADAPRCRSLGGDARSHVEGTYDAGTLVRRHLALLAGAAG